MIPEHRRRRRQWLPASLAVAALSIATMGSASANSGGGVGLRHLGAADAAIGRCDPDGVTVAYTNTFDTAASEYRVTSILVSGVHTACAGRTLLLTVKNSSGVGIYSASAVAAPSVTFSPTPFAASAVAGYAVAMVV